MNYITAIPVFLAATLIMGLGISVYKTNPQLVRNRALTGMCSAISLWFYCYSVNYFLPKNSLVDYIFKIGYIGVTFVWVTYLHFTVTFLNIRARWTLIGSYVTAIVLTVFTVTTNLIINGHTVHAWGPYPKAGFLHFLHLLYAGYIWLFCLAHLYVGYKNKKKKYTPDETNRIRYVFWAYFVGNIAAVDYVQNYLFDFNPIGWLNVTFWIGVMVYAIVRHKLLEIEVLIKKTLVFAGLFASIYAVIAGFMLLTQGVLENVVGVNRWISLIPSIAVIVMILKPLENFLIRVTDKFLFQKKYDYKELLKTFSTDVLTVLDMAKLTDMTVQKIVDIVKIENCAVMLKDNEKNVYTVSAAEGVDPKALELKLEANNTLVTYLQRTKGYLLTRDITSQKNVSKSESTNINGLKFELALPLMLNEDLIGILTLGKKKSDEVYTQDDLDILLTLARTVAIAISNARVLGELGKAQAEAAQREKMAVIGTLSAGINHEICNPLGIARGQCEAFLLNMRDGLYKNKPETEVLDKSITIMKKVIEQVDRATVITKRLSSFAKPSKNIYSDDISLHECVNEVVGLLGHDLKLEKIEIENVIPSDFPHIWGDKKQIEEVFFNIIRNGAQAIKENGRITVSGKKDGDKVLVNIEDTGHGISDENMKMLFNPFFTTKDPGKGTGLGLFIVKQVVERNKGRISVTSKVGVGTTFMLEFPVVEKVGV